MMRSNSKEHLDKVTFTEYTKLPGIINDRLHYMFSSFKKTRDSGASPKQQLNQKKQEDYITQESFIKNMVRIFLGDLESKMLFTFEMFDFDNDGYITSEDVRIMMSYLPLNRNVGVQDVQDIIDQRGLKNAEMSPTKLTKEGLGNTEKGKGFEERNSHQQEIKVFTDSVFKDLPKQRMDYKQYDKLNKQQSSEMFYSIMAILHERLPCSLNYFRMRRKFKETNEEC